MRRTATILLTCALAGTACGSDPKPEATPTASSAAPATQTTAPAATETDKAYTAGDPVFTDDFRTDTHGWTTKDTATVAYAVHDDYAQPLYSVTVRSPRLHVFPHPDFRPATPDYQVSATVQTTLSVGHEDLFGLTCRDDGTSRYSLSIGYDLRHEGTIPWRIVKHDADGSHLLNDGTAPTPGGSAFTVTATCAGGAAGAPADLVLTVNGAEAGRTRHRAAGRRLRRRLRVQQPGQDDGERPRLRGAPGHVATRTRRHRHRRHRRTTRRRTRCRRPPTTGSRRASPLSSWRTTTSSRRSPSPTSRAARCTSTGRAPRRGP